MSLKKEAKSIWWDIEHLIVIIPSILIMHEDDKQTKDIIEGSAILI